MHPNRRASEQIFEIRGKIEKNAQDMNKLKGKLNHKVSKARQNFTNSNYDMQLHEDAMKELVIKTSALKILQHESRHFLESSSRREIVQDIFLKNNEKVELGLMLHKCVCNTYNDYFACISFQRLIEMKQRLVCTRCAIARLKEGLKSSRSKMNNSIHKTFNIVNKVRFRRFEENVAFKIYL
jgi:superfamily II helicase